MKKIISKVLVLLFLFNMCIPISAFAQAEIQLYNHGNIVELIEDIPYYNRSPYISISDLGNIGLNYSFYNSELRIENTESFILTYPETSIVTLNGTTLLYKTPMVKINDVYYVSLDLIAMVFSSVYEEKDDTIYLWIDNSNYDTIRGVVSLPDGATAPEGGIDVCVFVGIPIPSPASSSGSSGGGGGNSVSNTSYTSSVYSQTYNNTSYSYPSAGYYGQNKPSLYSTVYSSPNSAQEYEYIVKTYVAIKSGKSCTEFALNAKSYDLLNSFIGYTSDSEDYKGGYAVKYYRGESYNLLLNNSMQTISGKIWIPNPATEDTEYTVSASGNNRYTYKGTIKEGTQYGEYSIAVNSNDKYSLSVIFTDGKYLRMMNERSVWVGTNDCNDIELSAEVSNSVKVELTLPENVTLSDDIYAEVVLQSASSPYYYLDRREVCISGSLPSEVTLYDDMDCDDVICFYTLENDIDSLYAFGNYSSAGTTCILDCAETFDLMNTQNISMQMIKANYVNVNVKLPDGEETDTNIFANIYPTVFLDNTQYNTTKMMLFSATESDFGDTFTCFNNISDSQEIASLIIQYAENLNINSDVYFNLSKKAQLSVCNRLTGTEFSSIEDLNKKINNSILIQEFYEVLTYSEINKIIQNNSDILHVEDYFKLSSSQQSIVCKELLNRLNSTEIHFISELSAFIKEITAKIMNSSGTSSGGGGGGGGSIAAKSPLIESGKTSGIKVLKIPDEDRLNYNIAVTSINGNDKYYSNIYYAGNEKASVFRENAESISMNATEISITLMRKYNIGGHIETSINCLGDNVYAIYQDNTSAIVPQENSKYIASGVLDENGNYSITVPEELKKQILQFTHNSNSVYYNNTGGTSNINEAQVIEICSDTDNIDFSYNGFNPPLPLELSVYNDVYGAAKSIFVENISDFAKNDITLYVAYYDKNEKLLDIKNKKMDTLDASTKCTAFKIDENDINLADSIKAFAWNGNIMPLSAHLSIENLPNKPIEDNENGNYLNAFMWMKAGSSTMYREGESFEVDVPSLIKENVLMSPLRALAESFGCMVEWEAETNSIILTYNNTEIIMKVDSKYGTINGEQVTLSTAPTIINDRTLCPINDIAKFLGFNYFWNESTGELFVYDDIDVLVNLSKTYGFIPKELDDINFRSNLTRLQLAQIAVQFHEKLSDEKINVKDDITYSDTSDKNVLKLSSIGVMNGITDNIFAPNDFVTNQELVVVIHRLLASVGFDFLDNFDDVERYEDDNSIADYAKNSVYRLKNIGVLDTVYCNKFEPTIDADIRTTLAILSNYVTLQINNIYSDVKYGDQYSTAIFQLQKKEIMNGYEDGTFIPEGTVTRAEICVFLCRILGEELPHASVDCEDVSANDWCYSYVGYCVNNGIISLENNKFRPYDNATASEVLSAFLNALGYDGNYDGQTNIMKAEGIGLLNNIDKISENVAIHRNVLAQLIYNSLK